MFTCCIPNPTQPCLSVRSAYIAASRRSDRSLEARVESARKASEIHKRRTGRSLRVAEQDVANEEVYEEEEDDPRIQYRQLAVHLQTASADFNRRLSWYLTNHVAMRSALEQAVSNSYAQQHSDVPHDRSSHPISVMHDNMPQHQPPPLYRPSSTPILPDRRPGHQSSSASDSPPSSLVQSTDQVDQQPASASLKSSSYSSLGAKSTPLLMQQRAVHSQTSQTSDVKQEDRASQMRPTLHPSPIWRQQLFQNMDGYPNISPSITSRPTQSQMLVGPALTLNDSMTTMPIAGSEHLPQPYDYSSPSSIPPPGSFQQSFDDLSARLEPNTTDISPRHSKYGQPQYTMSVAPSPGPALQFGFDGSVLGPLQ